MRTHYRFQIRTFWIGLLYVAVSWVATLILIGWLVGLFTLVWWIVRCAKGLKTSTAGVPYDNPTTWPW